MKLPGKNVFKNHRQIVAKTEILSYMALYSTSQLIASSIASYNSICAWYLCLYIEKHFKPNEVCTYSRRMWNLCLRLSEGNMRNDPGGKLRVVSSHSPVWSSRSRQSGQNSSSSSRHSSQRKPQRMSAEHCASPAQMSAGQEEHLWWCMSNSQCGPAIYK